jgi:hypothetical protein
VPDGFEFLDKDDPDRAVSNRWMQQTGFPRPPKVAEEEPEIDADARNLGPRQWWDDR